VMALGDRIAVMHGGSLSAPMAREDADLTAIGLMMAGLSGSHGLAQPVPQ
jgi:ABC-type uncharacterized transport system ATPase subunit